MSWWRAEGNAQDFAGGNLGTLIGDTSYTTGKVGQAFVFDGSTDLVGLGNPPGLQLQNFTIETWIRRSSAGVVTHGSLGIACLFAYGQNGYGLLLYPSGQLGLSKIGQTDTRPNVSITDTNYHHVAVTKSGTNVVFYVDGVNYPAPAYDPGFEFSTEVGIGARGDNHDFSFLGSIDELAVYSRALTSNEVAAIYQAGSAGKCPGPQSQVLVGPVNNPGNGHCYYLLSTNTWTASETAAQALGGHLVTINDATENTWVRNTFASYTTPSAKNMWIGLNDLAAKGTFAWADGEPTNYFNWNGFEPNDYNGNEDYGMMISANGLWNDADNVASPAADGNNPAYAFGIVEVACLVPPGILSQPTNVTTYVGGAASFTVSANGTLPLSYQWFFNNTNVIAGATNASYSLANAQLTNAGLYSVVVSNAINSVTSSNAVLTVNPPPSCVTTPANLVAWWRGEGDASDFLSGNNGTAEGPVAYGAGKVGQAFSLNGTNADVKIQASTALDVGQSPGFTLEAWINPSDLTQQRPIIEWNSGSAFGVHLWMNVSFNGVTTSGCLLGNVITTSGVNNIISSGGGILSTGVFQHVAFTFNRTNGNAVLYVNGAVVATNNFGSGLNPRTSSDLYLGYRPFGPNAGNRFSGKLDEVALYSRALASNEVAAIYGASVSGKCAAPVAPFIVTQPTNRTTLVGGGANFTVVASGSQPLSYQWLFNQTNVLGGATNATLTLANLLPANAGNYSVVVSNAVDSVTSSNALLTVNYPPALLQVVSVAGQYGQTVAMPVQLLANGNENALGFSLKFDSAILSVSNVVAGSNAPGASLLINTSSNASGYLGAALALDSGSTFASGNQQVAVVNFTIVAPPAGSNLTTTVVFSDIPTPRQLSDAGAGTLAAVYSNGVVSIGAVDWEADTAPRTNGNKQVTITDWVQVGRFVAGLDVPNDGLEYQKADCAPRATLGNGVLSVTDWVQAGRYAAGLDPLTVVGGPTSNNNAPVSLKVTRPRDIGRVVRVVDHTVQAAETNVVTVQLTSLGNENALGFSLSFNAAIFQYLGCSLGADASGATLNVNTNQTGAGQIGFALALPSGTSFASGAREILKLRFVVSSAATGTSNIVFASNPVVVEISDPAANALTSSYTPGLMTISPFPPSLTATTAGTNVIVTWPAAASDFSLQVNSSSPASTNWNSAPNTTVQGDQNATTITNPVGHQFYRLYRP